MRTIKKPICFVAGLGSSSTYPKSTPASRLDRLPRSWVFLIVLSLGLLVGCQQVALHQGLQEIEANEILVVLQQNGIEAKKEREVQGQEVSWKVSVGESEIAKARQILISNNLPRRRELGLSGVYKEKGLIPTPDEQKARFLLALKGEVINSLQKIPGVVDADVVLNVPTENEFAELDPSKKRPTASVVVRTRNDELAAQTVTEGKIQRFVANSVPNLDPNDVAVIVTRSDTGAPAVPSQGRLPFAAAPTDEGIKPGGDLVELAGIRMDEDSIGRFKAYMIGLLSLLVAVSIFLLVNIIRLNRMRLRVQRGVRPDRTAVAVEGGGGQSLLGEGGAARQGTMEGTFDVAGNSVGRGGR